jgi:hypothetical protein
MKKIINKALYNTETARLVGRYDNGANGGDFTRVDEDLYQTKSGKYFLHGDGGPMTTYAVHQGNSTSGGSEIIPMTVAEAQEWAEEKLTADEFQREFGPVDEATGEENERQTKVLIQALHTAHQDGDQLKAFIIRDALRMLGAIE